MLVQVIVLSNSNDNVDLLSHIHTHTHTHAGQTQRRRNERVQKSERFVCFVLLSLHTHINLHIFACVWVLWSRSLSLLFLFSFLDLAALTALANNLNSPTQSIDVFVLHVCYFFLFSFYYSFNEPCKLPLLYWNLGPSIFLILSRSQPAAGSFKIIQQKNEKTNTTENYFYFGL